MARSSAKPLCSRCERFDIQAFGRSRYAYQRLPLSTAVQSAGQGCSFCSLLVENLASGYLLDRSWLSRMTSALYVQLQAKRDHEVGFEDGGMAVYQITASVVKFTLTSIDRQLNSPPLHLVNINVSADQSKIPTASHRQKSLWADTVAEGTQLISRYTCEKFERHCW